jgi:hypothetical protein
MEYNGYMDNYHQQVVVLELSLFSNDRVKIEAAGSPVSTAAVERVWREIKSQGRKST